MPQSQVKIQVVLAEVHARRRLRFRRRVELHRQKRRRQLRRRTDFNIAKQLTQFGGFSSAVSAVIFISCSAPSRRMAASKFSVARKSSPPITSRLRSMFGQRIPLITDSRIDQQTISTTRSLRRCRHQHDRHAQDQSGWLCENRNQHDQQHAEHLDIDINKNATVPIINQRRRKHDCHRAKWPDGDFGGLIETTDDRRVKKCRSSRISPAWALSSRSSTSTRGRKELLILLTPQVLMNPTSVALPRPLEESRGRESRSLGHQGSTARRPAKRDSGAALS